MHFGLLMACPITLLKSTKWNKWINANGPFPSKMKSWQMKQNIFLIEWEWKFSNLRWIINYWNWDFDHPFYQISSILKPLISRSLSSGIYPTKNFFFLTKYWENIFFSSENSTNFGKVLENSLVFRYHKIGGKKKPCMTCPSTTRKGEKKFLKNKRKKTRVYLEPENISGCRLLSSDLCNQQVPGINKISGGYWNFWKPIDNLPVGYLLFKF